MNKIITNKQLLYLIILMSLAPIHKHIPKAVSSTADASGYISVFLSGIITFLLSFGVFYLIKKFPAMNLYDIMKMLFGTFLSKLILAVIVIWSGINAITILHFHSLMAQSTIMPFTPDRMLFPVMLALTGYCLYKGIKVAMRISELLLGMFLILLLWLMLISLQNFDVINLLPVSFDSTPEIIKATPYPLSIFGFIIFALFYCDKLDKPEKSFKPYVYFTLMVSLIALSITVITIGVEGADLSATYTFPFYSVIKRASLLNIFERLEAFLLLPTFFSDFIQLTVFMSALLFSLNRIFDIKHKKTVALFVFVLVFGISLFIERTQFELEAFYYNYLAFINFAFEYGLVLVLVVTTLIRHKKVKAELENI